MNRYLKHILMGFVVCIAAVFTVRRSAMHDQNSVPRDFAPRASNFAPGPPVVPLPAFKFNFYVAPGGNDTNVGSAESRWATLQHAADVVKPGSIVHVAPGTYGGVTTLVSGTASAPIRFLSDVRWGARVRTVGLEQMWNNAADHIDIMGFDISGDGRNGILNMGSFVRIIGNNVHDIPAPCTASGGAGINNANYRARDDEVMANVVHDIGSLQGECNHVHGIYHSNLRGQIVNNISYRNQGWGIHLWHAADQTVIANNLVFDNGSGGIVVGAGDAPGGVTASGSTVVNNMVMDNHSVRGAGIAIYEFGLTAPDNHYANNLVWNNSRGVVLQNGVHAVNTVEANPRLINYRSDGSGDYHLRPNSPAIKAGTRLPLLVFDFNGARRTRDAAPDIGPFEFGAFRQAWPWM